METWFIFAVIGALFAGLSNFYFKIAAVRGYSPQLFTLYGSLTSLAIASSLLVISPEPLFSNGWLAVLVLILGLFSALAGMLKIYALRYIDSTIYFPLFKLLAPLLAIIAGVLLFGERFSFLEWFGMLLGLLVPLMLITKSEDHRQNNLLAGLFLVLITGVISAASATVNKFVIDEAVSVNLTLLYSVIGIGIGALISLLFKYGASQVSVKIKTETTIGLVYASIVRASLITVSVWCMLYAFSAGGTLAVVQTVHSMYILIPIVLAIIFYKEHWNTQKIVAITLSVAALGFLQ